MLQPLSRWSRTMVTVWWVVEVKYKVKGNVKGSQHGDF
jgi:hypothetical protein